MKLSGLAIDLFSGCGGLTEGLKGAKFRVIAGAEIRPEARAAYLENHPEVHVFEDVRKVTLAAVNAHHPLKRGELDVLAACPPCQGFSTMRTKKLGRVVNDERNNLIFEVSRIAAELLPKAILVENVPGLLKNYRVTQFRKDLKKLGYITNSAVLDASEFGVPQRRKRMIFIAILSEQKPTIPKPTTPTPMTVREVIDGIHFKRKDQSIAAKLHRIRQKLSENVLRRVKRIPKDGGSRKSLGKEGQLPCHQDKEGFNDVYGRLAWGKVAPTITRSCHNPSKGRFLHPKENRGLTIYEAMLLQGFPATYKLPTDKGIGKAASLIGEAFPPPFAEAQALHVQSLLLQAFGERQSVT
jgi:DNA (cytosine-5)-methyltransferase 1